MSFAEKTDDLVYKLVTSEFWQACNEHGENFNSYHEMYAVLQEELEEVNDNLQKIEFCKNKIWNEIKRDCVPDVLETYDSVCETIKELAQVGAVLLKCKRGLKEC
jgi:hypothetical protein